MKTPTVIALRIRTHTHSIETKIDELMGEVGMLLSEMTEFSNSAEISRAVGQRPLTRIAQLQGKLIEARSKIVGAHGDMRRIAETADMPTYCPEKRSQLEVANG